MGESAPELEVDRIAQAEEKYRKAASDLSTTQAMVQEVKRKQSQVQAKANVALNKVEELMVIVEEARRIRQEAELREASAI
jgi:hypothetical protein